MASKLLKEKRLVGVVPLVRPKHQPVALMNRDLQTRFFAVFLALLSVAAVVFACINFQKDREYSSPYDGVWWVEDGQHLRAERVDADGPGSNTWSCPSTPSLQLRSCCRDRPRRRARHEDAAHLLPTRRHRWGRIFTVFLEVDARKNDGRNAEQRQENREEAGLEVSIHQRHRLVLWTH